MPWWKAYGKALLVVVLVGSGVLVFVIGFLMVALYYEQGWALLYVFGWMMLIATIVLAEYWRRG